MTETLDKTVQGRSAACRNCSGGASGRTLRIRNLDSCAALIAVLLPWTTTGTLIAIGLFADRQSLFTDLRATAGDRCAARCASCRVALVGLALVGTLWSDAPWPVRIHAIGAAGEAAGAAAPDLSLQRSPLRRLGVCRLPGVMRAADALLLLVAIEPRSVAQALFLARAILGREGIAVRNYIDQSQEFALCAPALAYPIAVRFRAGRIAAAVLLAALALGFLANMMFVVVSRTALRDAAGPDRAAGAAASGAANGTAHGGGTGPGRRRALGRLAATAQHRRQVPHRLRDQLDGQRDQRHGLPAGILAEIAGLLADAPLIGHGSGSTRGLFERAAVGQDSACARSKPSAIRITRRSTWRRSGACSASSCSGRCG